MMFVLVWVLLNIVIKNFFIGLLELLQDYNIDFKILQDLRLINSKKKVSIS